MFETGFLELLVLGLVGLLVLGPERLPKAARGLGLWVGQIKRTLSGMQREISAQLKTEELRQTLEEKQHTLDTNLLQAKHAVERITEPELPGPSKQQPTSPRAPSGMAVEEATRPARHTKESASR